MAQQKQARRGKTKGIKTPPNPVFVVSDAFRLWRMLGDNYLRLLLPAEREALRQFAAREVKR